MENEKLINWTDIEKEVPEEGYEVLLFNENWKNEDFNPKGIRIGFLDGIGGWISAHWCNYHDTYHTRTSCEDDTQFEDFKAENQVPTHWMEIPQCANNVLEEVFEWKIKNNAGEQFKFFIDEENRACFNVKSEKELLAGLIMSKKEFEELINNLIEMMKHVSM